MLQGTYKYLTEILFFEFEMNPLSITSNHSLYELEIIIFEEEFHSNQFCEQLAGCRTMFVVSAAFCNPSGNQFMVYQFAKTFSVAGIKKSSEVMILRIEDILVPLLSGYQILFNLTTVLHFYCHEVPSKLRQPINRSSHQVLMFLGKH